jgi:hypothetical protein
MKKISVALMALFAFSLTTVSFADSAHMGKATLACDCQKNKQSKDSSTQKDTTTTTSESGQQKS